MDQRVTHKTLRISRTFGIEGRKLLTPEDDYEALKNFNHAYEGTPTSAEDMHLEYQRLLREFPDLTPEDVAACLDYARELAEFNAVAA